MRAEAFEAIKRELDLKRVMEESGAVFKNNKCLCIFHNDKHPSVSVKGGRFKCFACGAGGDIFDWICQRYNISLYQGAKLLCDRYSLPYANEGMSRHERRIMAEEEAHRRARKKIAEIQQKKKGQKYMELCDEYRELGFLLEEEKERGAPPDEVFYKRLARRQYLGQLMDMGTEEAAERAEEFFAEAREMGMKAKGART